MLGYKKGNKKLLTGQIPLHYPGDRVYLDGDPTKSVQDKCARKADLTNLDLTGTTNTTGSTIASGTYFYLNGTLVRAKTTIASGATFTLNTNYEVVTAGGLNNLNNLLGSRIGNLETNLTGKLIIGGSLNDLKETYIGFGYGVQGAPDGNYGYVFNIKSVVDGLVCVNQNWCKNDSTTWHTRIFRNNSWGSWT